MVLGKGVRSLILAPGILKWVNEAYQEVMDGGGPSRRRNQVLEKEKVETRFRISLKDP